MLAVAVYAFPRAYKDNPVLNFLRHHFNDSIRPYVLVTSQWQSWPLFAPDPTRRVTRMYVEYNKPDEDWEMVEGMDYESIAWWRHAKEVKLIERITDEERIDIRKRYLQLECERKGITKQLILRSKYRYYIIPTHKIQMPVQWWREWEPYWQEYADVSITCNKDLS